MEPIDSQTGTLSARHGALERLTKPDLLDIASPIFAFVMVILLPCAIALWVIRKTLKS